MLFLSLILERGETMQLKLMKNNHGNNVVNKTFDSDETITIDPIVWKDSSSIENPTFTISQMDADDIVDYNYCYVPKWRRYYFIDNWNVLQGKLLEMECSVDVLKTFSHAIKNSTQLVSRQESVAKGNAFLVDAELIMDNDVDIEVRNFGIELNPASNKYVIQIAEGGD